MRLPTVLELCGHRARAVTAAALLAAGALVTVPAPAGATVTTITVSSAADAGPGTLRAALVDASSGGGSAGGDVVVEIPAGIGPIVLAGSLTYDGGSGGGHDLTVAGAGTVITGNDTFGLLAVTTTGTTTLGGLALSRGSATVGGAVATTGPLTVTDSTFTDNTSTNLGGAINSQSTLVITDSTFTGNESTADSGGGVWATTSVEVTRSVFTGNVTATYGAAVISGGPVTAVDSVFDANVAPLAAGAIAGNGVLTAVRSTFTNHASYSGSALYTGGEVVAIDSTFAGNSATGYGSAIAALGGVTATNSTFVDNVSTNPGVATIVTYGAAKIAYSTLTQAPTVDAGVLVAGSTIELFGSVLQAPGEAAVACSTNATSWGYNLVDDTSCGLAGTGDVQRAGIDPLLGPLGDNGGPTPTRMPRPTSPLLGAIPNAACRTVPLATAVVTDQRGAPRPTEPVGTCDVGAVQHDGPPPPEPAVPEPTFTG